MFKEPSILTDKISLRSVKLPDDESFLREVYSNSREEDFRVWSEFGEAEAEKLLEMQFNAQKFEYEQCYPEATNRIILFEHKAVGRFLYDQTGREFRCVDIAVMSEYQNLGIGTAVLKSFMDEVVRTNHVFALQVLKTNRALRLYQRLGFKIVGENASHIEMEWSPTGKE